MGEKWAWPLRYNGADKETEVVITGIDDVKAFDAVHDKIVVMTEGWAEGSAAAILRGGVNAMAVLDVLARSGVKEVKVYHIEEQIPQFEDIFLSSVVAEAHELFDNINICWRHDPSVYELVKSIRSEHGMLFFGAPLAKSEVAPFYQRIKEVFNGSITLVRAPVTDVEASESDEIYKWVRERTFNATDFSLPAVLRNYKKKLGVRIAVILPTLNEEKTVGKVIETGLEVKGTGLIDDLILIDSDSTDNTVAIGKSYGVPVYYHREIRPDLGGYSGKGEAMFKSSFVTDADILGWIDTDIENITPRFFYGLLGPMLADPGIRFVKGYFSRPVRVEASGLELGGGRVTEILARPWINTFLPQLSGYIQPLAGTVAIYRDVMTKMRIPSNYGVEIAMLIQAVQFGGLWSTCQVNLGEVIHKSKDVLGLSEMSFQILQVLAHLMHEDKADKASNTLRRVFSSHGKFEIGIKRFQTHWRQF